MWFLKDKEEGMVLILTLMVTFLLLLGAAWLIYHTRISFKISGLITKYEVCLNLADGGCDLGIRYLYSHTPSPEDWNLSNISKCTLPDELSDWQRVKEEYSYKTEIEWRGYDTKPLPGWMLNWQGYTRFYRIHYKVKGEGEFRNSSRQVSALIIKIAR